MLISQKIKKRILSEDKGIIINLNSVEKQLGEEQQIDNYIDTETNLAINPVVDGEKFIYKQKLETSYDFLFYDPIAKDFKSTFLVTQGFTADEISGSSVIQNSFFIAQYYDSSDLDNQTLLHQSYFNGYRFYIQGASTNYGQIIIRNSEFANIYLSEDFVSQKPNKFNIYVRYYFYNAKRGDVTPMLADKNESLTTSNRLFYKVIIDKSARNFRVSTSFPVTAKQILNNNYKNKISDTLQSTPRERLNPPAGGGFSNDGKYIELG